MPKSRKRKDHRKKVASRNQKTKAAQTAMQKFMTEAMQKELEKLKEQNAAQSGTTDSFETNTNDVESIQS